ncbi:MAG: AT hook domain-containing protein [Erysipelotrichaceae bacterium]
MKGPGIKDYLDAIDLLLKKAEMLGESKLVVSSKVLHSEVSLNHATMPTCCQAIYKRMKNGDEITQRPKGTTGFGSHLTVEYNLINREECDLMFPSKKRGRPAKSEEEKQANKRAKMKRNTEDLSKLVKAWLGEHGWAYEESKDYIEAFHDDKKWVINVQGIKRGRKQTLPVKLSEVMKRIDDENAHYSIAFNDSLTYRRQWNEIPSRVKERLNMSVILADKKGNITEL